MKAKLFLLFFGLLGFVVQAVAKEKIYVNSEVTTHIVMPENIKLVDISTTKIMGNQCADNMVRIKPYLEQDSIKASFDENELLGTITLIGERHIAQYDVVYTHYPSMAASIFEVAYSDTQSYINPEVSMPKAEMVEISENQISGRVITLTIEYEDILNADGFDSDILKNSSCYPYYYIYR